MSQTKTALNKEDFNVLSEFRYQMRRFEHFSDAAIQAEGITPLQYLLLLHTKGYPGREWATVGELAERLQAKPHGVVALVSRCEVSELVERRVNAKDRRCVEIHLLPAGEKILRHLAEKHRKELKSLKDIFFVPELD
jgi:DNA-binding MarR family transcriptional regulator